MFTPRQLRLLETTDRLQEENCLLLRQMDWSSAPQERNCLLLQQLDRSSAPSALGQGLCETELARKNDNHDEDDWHDADDYHDEDNNPGETLEEYTSRTCLKQETFNLTYRSEWLATRPNPTCNERLMLIGSYPSSSLKDETFTAAQGPSMKLVFKLFKADD